MMPKTTDFDRPDVAISGDDVQYWNVFTQRWNTRRADLIPDSILATFGHEERQRVIALADDIRNREEN